MEIIPGDHRSVLDKPSNSKAVDKTVTRLSMSQDILRSEKIPTGRKGTRACSYAAMARIAGLKTAVATQKLSFPDNELILSFKASGRLYY